MKSYQFFKIYKRLDKERENICAAINENREKEETWTLFLFYEPLKYDN